jgi:hypothetical protein
VTPEEAATLNAGDVIEYGGTRHKVRTVVVYRQGERPETVINLSVITATGHTLRLVPLREPDEPLPPEFAARLDAARIIARAPEAQPWQP